MPNQASRKQIIDSRLWKPFQLFAPIIDKRRNGVFAAALVATNKLGLFWWSLLQNAISVRGSL
uniref:Predicted protein n=1 Tax=Hordeum vulgare subsp. vulgare TaxID=112509 RepID=F2DRR4_HORVV|nr:predicted protein [Hordeum vulgare subsp. vulgare]